MLRVVCCDDEREMRKALIKIIEPELQLQGMKYQLSEFSSGEDLLNSQMDAIDLLFLDIEMKDLDGIETAKQLRKVNPHAMIIFITAFADFVFQGYEVRALNYLLKPYNKRKILAVLKDALAELDAEKKHYFIIEQKASVIKMALKDIYYFTSDRRKVTAITTKEPFTFYGKLNDLELPDYFLRIHNRYLVNLNHVVHIESTFLYCRQEQLPISRKYRQALMINFARNSLG